MKEEWKRQMQQKMADYQESDIDLSWSEIEKALAANRRQARVVALWPRRIAAAAVILLIAGIGYWTLHRQEQPIIETGIPQEILTAKTVEESLSPQEDLNQGAPQVNKCPIQRRSQALAICPTDSTRHTDSTSPTDSTATPVMAEAMPESESAIEASPMPRPTIIYPSDLRRKASTSNRLTAKVYFSNATSDYSSLMSSTQQVPIYSNPSQNPNSDTPSNPGGQIYPPDGEGGIMDNPIGGGDPSSESGDEPESGPPSDEQNEEGAGQQVNTRQNNPQDYRTQQTDETTHHHQPIRIGLSLRYRINEHWSVESGLTYTRLTSDFIKTVDGESTTTEQKLAYVGIPVSISYLFWESRYLNIYASAGAMVEKMVKGSRTTNGITNSVSIQPLQFSLNGSIGAEFRFNRQFSLYAEPGLGYWFDNGSSIPTYYQDKPLSFSLSLGLRISPW